MVATSGAASAIAAVEADGGGTETPESAAGVSLEQCLHPASERSAITATTFRMDDGTIAGVVAFRLL